MVSVSPSAMAATEQTEYIPQNDMTFVSLDMGDYKLSDGVDAHIFESGKVCIDLDQFMRALEFQISYSPETETAKGWFLDESRLFHLDVKNRRVTVGGIPRTYPQNAIFKTDLGLCITTDVLQDWFPTNLLHEPQGALISVVSREPLPVELRLAREERKRSLQDQNEPELEAVAIDGKKVDYSWYQIPNFDIFARIDLLKDEFGSTRRAFTYSAIAVGEIAKMTAETLLQSDSGGVPDSLRLRLYRRDENGGVFGVKSLTEVAVGDVSGISNSLLNISAPGRGVSLSSYPINTSDEFDRTTLRGDMPAGWEAELFRNDALVAFQNANENGRYEFTDVPVFFGINEFKIVLHGPQGQHREIKKLLNTGAVTAQPGKFYGRALLQQDYRELIRIRKRPDTQVQNAPLRIQAEGRYGVFNNLSVGGSISSFEQQGIRQTYGSLSAQTAVGRSFVNFEGITNTHGEWAGEASLQRSFSGLSLQLRHAQFSDGFGSQKVAAGIKSRTEASVVASVPVFSGTRIPVSMRTLLNRQYDGSAQLQFDEQSSISFGKNNIGQSLSVNADLNRGQPTFITGSTIYSRRLRENGIRAFASYNIAPSLELRSLGIGYDQYTGIGGKKWYWNANADWQFYEKVGNFTVGASREFSRFALNLEAAASTKRVWSVGASIAFSLSRDPVRSGWSMSPEASAQSGNVIARIFEDMNNDGNFSTGDIPIKNAEIISGDFSSAKTDANGRIFLKGLPSNSTTLLKALAPADYPVDLIEAKPSNAVVARAGTVNSIDIPMVVSGSVEGQIDFVRGQASRPLRGIMVKLIGEDRTIIQYSEYDGYYLFQNIPTGQYRIELDEQQIGQMGLAGTTMRGIEVSRQRPYPAGLNFKLEPRLGGPIIAAARTNGPATVTRITANGVFSDAIAGSMERLRISIAATYADFNEVRTTSPANSTRDATPHSVALQALFGDEIMNVPLAPRANEKLALAAVFGDEMTTLPVAEKSDNKIALVAIFGDDLIDIPVPKPRPAPARKLPPTIVVIGPRFEETLATAGQPAATRKYSKNAPIS
jgi:hypothetical protein